MIRFNKLKSKIKIEEKAITLIALVITIIILLILAGVALGNALGENGLFKRAKTASEKYNKSEKEESSDIDKLNDAIDDAIDFINNRKLLAPGIKIDGKSHEGYEEWYFDDVTVTITDEVAKANSKAKKIRYEITGAEERTDTVNIPEEGDREISFQITTEGESTVKAYILDERGREVESEKEEIVRIDKTAPTIEIEQGEIGEDSIEVKVKNKEDLVSGVKEYKYGIKEEQEEQMKYSEKTEKETFKFTGATEAKYKIKAKAIDSAGNEGESNEIEIIKQYTVSFDSNGGSSCTAIKVSYEGTYTNLPTPTRTGYTFNGWYTSETSNNGSGTQVTNTSKIVKNEDHTLYAKWTLNTYTVSFDSNGGSSCTAITVNYGGTYGSLPTPTRAGYTFNGWYTSETSNNGSGTKVTNTSTIAKNENHTLYANWSIITYTVSFDSNGGSACTAIKVNYGGKYTSLPTPTRTGYTFNGWYTSETSNNGSGTKVTNTTTIIKNEDHTLYAQWEKSVFLLYDNGNEHSENSGGWRLCNSVGTWGNGILTRSENKMTVRIPLDAAYRSGGAVTNNLIDLSNYNTLYVDLQPYGTGLPPATQYWGAWIFATTYQDNMENSKDKNTRYLSNTRDIVSLDVSSIKEGRYISISNSWGNGVVSGGNLYIDIFKVWLE